MADWRERGDRRRGPDVWVKSLRWLATVGWLLMVAALWVASEAKPEMETFLQRWGGGAPVRRSWDLELARYILYLMFPGLLIGYGGLIVNLMRSRRHKDEVRISLILLAIMATIGTIICIVMF